MKTSTTKTSGMLLPKKTIMKTQSAATNSIPPLVERPIEGLSSSIPKRPIGWIPYGPKRPGMAYFVFMLEFRKTDECESTEKFVYEGKALEKPSRHVKYIEEARELKRKQDVNEGEAKVVPLAEKANPDVDATKEGNS